jgi:signal peptidase I
MKAIFKVFKLTIICVVLIFALSLVSAHLPFILISGSSMEPTFKDGQIVYLDRNFEDIKRGDVVIFKQQVHFSFDEKLIKRVCGIPGDKVYKDKAEKFFIYDGKNIFYYDKKVSDVLALLESSTYLYTLDDNQYFCMGDNRDESIDSRSFGAIDRKKILALVKDDAEIPKAISCRIK